MCHMKKRCFKSCDTVKWLQYMVSAGSSLAFRQAPAEGIAAVQCHNPVSRSNTQHVLDAAGQQVFDYQWLIYGVIEHKIGSKLLFHIFEYEPASEATA